MQVIDRAQGDTCIDGVDQFRTPVLVWYTQKFLDPAADAVIGRAFSRLVTISQYIRVDHRISWTMDKNIGSSIKEKECIL
jgi:hypothetical protein